MLRGRFFSRRSRYGAALQCFQDAFVLRPDDLLALTVAIALATGRAKDFARIVQFVEDDLLDRPVLEDILTRHGLMGKWSSFSQRYLEKP